MKSSAKSERRAAARHRFMTDERGWVGIGGFPRVSRKLELGTYHSLLSVLGHGSKDDRPTTFSTRP